MSSEADDQAAPAEEAARAVDASAEDATTEPPAEIPSELPETPAGYTRRMSMHLNCGRSGHVGVYEVHSPEGALMPFTYRYNTGKDGSKGFVIHGMDAPISWERLRGAYRVFMAGVKYGKECR